VAHPAGTGISASGGRPSGLVLLGGSVSGLTVVAIRWLRAGVPGFRQSGLTPS
jgi:hypothetical protein